MTAERWRRALDGRSDLGSEVRMLLLMVAVAALWTVGYYLPRLETAADQQAAAAGLQRLKARAESVLDRAEEIRTADQGDGPVPAAVDTTEAPADGLVDAFAMMTRLNELESGLGVSVSRMTPLDQGGGGQRVAVAVDCTGSLRDVATFLHRVERGDDPMVVERFQLSADGEARGHVTVRMQVTRPGEVR